jgi:hypothetical protein
MMTNAEHLIENAVTALESHDPYDAYSIFMYNPCNAEMAALAGVSLDVVWEMAQYCYTTLRTEWQGDNQSSFRWIPVTERLPEVGEEFVLVFVNGRYHNIKFAGAAEIAMYDEDGWWIEAYPEWKNPRVTHWMPLPDVPKEGHNG